MHTLMKTFLVVVTAATVLAVAADNGNAVTVGDITRIEGQRVNKLIGHGLVVGLSGTGDSGDFQPAIRPLMQMLSAFSNPVQSTKELAKTKNVAIVMVTVTVPEAGVRNGDRLDVQVSAIGDCKSLIGGRLMLMPLQGPQKNSIVYALAEGALRIEDPKSPTNAVIDQGAVMEEDITTEYVTENKFRLVLKEGSDGFAMSAQVAKIINQANLHRVGQNIARALDAKTIEVEVPEADRTEPVGFIGDVQRLYLLLPRTEARIKINPKAGTIVITGNVEISPTVVSHGTLVVSTRPAVEVRTPPAQQGADGVPTGPVPPPLIEEGPFFRMDSANEGGAQLQDLVTAMNVLKVPAEDRIAIIKLLDKTGQIQAKVTFAE
jgi:flagellar P-ring protein precursor FlgI